MTNFGTAMREYFQHLAVVAEHCGFELGDAALARDECEMFEQDRADALALVFIENRECDFRATRIFSANVAADSHEAKVDRLLAESAKMLVETILIVGGDGADSDRSAVAQRGVDGVFSGIDAHVPIY